MKKQNVLLWTISDILLLFSSFSSEIFAHVMRSEKVNGYFDGYRGDAHRVIIFMSNYTRQEQLIWEVSEFGVWIPFPPPVEVRRVSNSIYIINYLQPETTYHIRARLFATSISTSELKIQTCPTIIPRILSTRIASSGPGWLDIRWKPYSEPCFSLIGYKVMYMAEGTTVITEKILSLREQDVNLQSRVEPIHPCDTWPEEFCILLTDNVHPGARHKVQIQTARLGIDQEILSEPAIVFAVANTTNFGPVDRVECLGPPATTLTSAVNVTSTGRESCINGVLVPLWGIILAVIFILAMFGIAVSLIIRMLKETQSPESGNKRSTNEGNVSNLRELYEYPAIVNNIMK